MMKTKKLLLCAMALPGLVLIASNANAVTSATVNGVTFTDLHALPMFDSNTSGGTDGGPIDALIDPRGTFSVDVLGPMACIQIDGMDSVGNTAGTVYYFNSVPLDITIKNLQGYTWKNLTVELFQDERCTVPSPDPDQWAFAENDPSANRPPSTNAPGSVFHSEEGPLIDRLRFEFDASGVPHNTTVNALLTLGNGTPLGPGLGGTLSMKIAPEPSSMALLGLGALGLFFRRRRA
ncbi:MAG TPA: PEP-CTERM sorting domain-containing protein [Verrucomicrobiales bacterium]|nr:PEP-CTERM sorting domain-containing protein [Verrucomicrobiales bacterium]